jgi:general secretion pathway protein G
MLNEVIKFLINFKQNSHSKIINFKINYLVIFLFSCCISPIYANTDKIKVVQIQLEDLGVAILMFKRDTGHFPPEIDGLNSLISMPKNTENWHGPYITKVFIPSDVWGKPYIYLNPAQYGSKEYDLYSVGPNGIDEHGAGDDVTNWQDSNLTQNQLNNRIIMAIISLGFVLIIIRRIIKWKQKSVSG